MIEVAAGVKILPRNLSLPESSFSDSATCGNKDFSFNK